MSDETIPPRPKKTDEMLAATAAKIADEMISDGLIEASHKERFCHHLARAARWDRDGFHLAKELDPHGWDMDAETVEILDGFDSHLDKFRREAEAEWAKKYDIKPAFTDGTHIRLNTGETGIITGVAEYAVASYLVAIDGDKDASGPHQSRRIVRFEDATAMEGAPA